MLIVTALRFTVRDALIRFPVTDRPGAFASVVLKWLGVAAVVAAYAVLAGSLEYWVTDEIARRFGIPSRETLASVSAALVVLVGIAVAWNVRLPALAAAVLAAAGGAGVIGHALGQLAGWAWRPAMAESGTLVDLFGNLDVIRDRSAAIFDTAVMAAAGHAGVLSVGVHSGGQTPLLVLVSAWVVVALAYAGWIRAHRP